MIEQDGISTNYGHDSIKTLNGLAWIILISGIIGAIVIWATMGTRIEPGYNYLTEANPTGILLGFEVLIFSVVTCVFLNSTLLK